jgi:biopolymer transport protein ExbB/TolQ
MAQLQKELVHAMADRFEAERKFRIVTAQIMAEEARQARILELQQQVKDDQMHCNIQYILSLRQGREIATTNTTNNGLTTLAVAASMPPFLGMTQRIPEVVVAPPREQLFVQPI